MVNAVNDRDEPAIDLEHDPVAEPETPLSDGALLDLLDALVDQRGRVPAARVLGVNYRTLSHCCDSRQVSRRMRQALVEFRDAGGYGGGEVGNGVDGAPPDGDVEALRQRVADLEDENAELRELADGQARQLEELAGRLAELDDDRQSGGTAGVVDVDTDAADATSHDRDAGMGRDWRPPRRRPGMPDAGVVTLEEQPDEALAFGSAAPMVVEWRRLRSGSGQSVSRVDRAQAAVRRWELEALMLAEYHLTLPPETFPLDEERRREHVRWRQDALAEARRELRKARRARWLRRVVTFGLWRR